MILISILGLLMSFLFFYGSYLFEKVLSVAFSVVGYFMVLTILFLNLRPTGNWNIIVIIASLLISILFDLMAAKLKM